MMNNLSINSNKDLFFLLVNLLMLGFYPLAIHSQQSLPKEVPSPTASNLGMYGNIPVSYCSGRANVSIPLYELNVKDVSMPVELCYDTSGILINSLPSWTGQNWSLNTGGAITRVKNGFYDEYEYPKHLQPLAYGFINYFHSYNALKRHLSHGDEELQDSLCMLHRDYAPDVFHFNFMGHSGRFFLGNDGDWKVQSDDNIEVIFDVNDKNNYILPFISRYPYSLTGGVISYQPKCIKGFILRDDNGTQYHFGQDISAIEFTTNFFSQGNRECQEFWAANSWYLTKVIDRYGNQLYSLEYERGKFIAQLYHVAGRTDFESSASMPASLGGHYGDSYSMSSPAFPYNGTLNSPVFLKNVIALNGTKVVFYSSELSEKPYYMLYPTLCKNSYYSNSNELESRVDRNTYNEGKPFFYLQTNDNSIKKYQYIHQGDDRYRPNNPLMACCLRKLNTITVTNSEAIRDTVVNYSFEYNTDGRFMLSKVRMATNAIHYAKSTSYRGTYLFDYNQAEKLPENYLTTAEDHWGYYNGRTYNIKSMKPQEYHALSSVREPNANVSQYGMLKRIVYPTGGCSVLEYEQNDYSKCMSGNRTSLTDKKGQAGGLRIKAIAEYEDTTEKVLLQKRSFKYQIPGTANSSGQLYAEPRYCWENWYAKPHDSNAWSKETVYRNVSIVPMSNSFDGFLGYSYVEETAADGTKTVYQYSNIADYPDRLPWKHYSQSLPTPYDEYSERGYGRGRILGKTIYDKNGNLRQKTTYDYFKDNIETDSVITSNLETTTLGSSASFTTFLGGIHSLYYPKFSIKQQTTETIEEGGEVTDRTNYEYYDFVLSASFGNFSHKTNVRKLKSEKTTRNGSSSSTALSYQYPQQQNSIMQAMAKNMFWLPVVETTQAINGKVQKISQTEFKRINGNIVPKQEIIWHKGIIPDTAVIYNSYTKTGAIGSYTEKGRPVTQYIWALNDCLLMGKIVGQTVSVPFIDDNNVFNQSFVMNKFQVLRNKKGGEVTSYTYSPNLLLNSITQSNGYTLYYMYDDFRRLKEIRNSNGNIIKSFNYEISNQ